MTREIMFDVIGVGTNSVDTVYTVPHLPERDGTWSKVPVSARTVRLGGQTATCLATCARFGLRAAYLGAFGNDEPARQMRDELTRRGIDLRFAAHRDVPNHYAAILVDERTGDRLVMWGRDAALSLSETEITADAMASARLVHVDDVDADAAVRSAHLARAAGVFVTSDLDRVNDRTPELVRAVSVPVFASHVPEALTGERDLERALRRLRREHEGLLCVTLGAEGAAALDGDRFVREPGFAVTALDTTGAGDVFRGALIYGLLNSWPVDRMLRFANAAAATSCTRAGALDGVPSLAEVQQRLARGVASD